MSVCRPRGEGTVSNVSHLRPLRHGQGDFFVADLRGLSAKDDVASMEHPLFALKAGDRGIRRYEHKGNSIEVQPGAKGQATIHDKDVWIYCISQLVHALDRGREDVSRTVRFTAYDFLVATNRGTGGREYELLSDALDRLSGTRIKTNIETSEYREKRGFGLVDAWRVVERRGDNRMVAVEVTLPDWLYRSVLDRQVLTLDADYFRLRKPLDRRLYELARKHCGAQSSWKVALKVLHTKTGSTGPLKKFRLSLKSLADTDELPGYRVKFDAESDAVTFYARKPKGQIKALRDQLKGP